MYIMIKEEVKMAPGAEELCFILPGQEPNKEKESDLDTSCSCLFKALFQVTRMP